MHSSQLAHRQGKDIVTWRDLFGKSYPLLQSQSKWSVRGNFRRPLSEFYQWSDRKQEQIQSWHSLSITNIFFIMEHMWEMTLIISTQWLLLSLNKSLCQFIAHRELQIFIHLNNHNMNLQKLSLLIPRGDNRHLVVF